MSDYLHDYHTLGLEPGCSLAALKAARRRLVKSWHPDRFPSGSAEKRQAEERIKDINTAFDRLTGYHATYGILPSASESARRGPSVIVVDPAATAAPRDSAEPAETSPPPVRGDRRTPSADRRSVWRHRALRWAIGLVATAMILEVVRTGLIIESRDPGSGPAAPAPPTATPEPRATLAPERGTRASRGEEYFTIGSTLGDVYAIQGVPTATEHGVWHYGKSKVYFANGVVISWEHDPADPLKATALPETTKSNPLSFTLGSTKAEVRAVQGAPLIETDTLWDYGLSKVYFHDGKVTGWDSSPMYPLKARK